MTAAEWRAAIEGGRVAFHACRAFPGAFADDVWILAKVPEAPTLWFDPGEDGRWQASVDLGPMFFTINHASVTGEQPIARCFR